MGIDVLKEMEVIGKKLKASKVAVVTSSGFSSQAKRYAEERKIKLVDRNDLVTLAKKYNNQKKRENEPVRLRREGPANIDRDSFYNRDVNLDYIDNVETQTVYDRGLNRVPNPYDSYDEYESDIDYYESQVGGIDLSGYSEYDDDLYRAEFLNKHPSEESGFSNILIANNRDPYVNSPPVSNSRSLFSKNKLSSLNSRNYTKNSSNAEPKKQRRTSRTTNVSKNNSRLSSQRFMSSRDSVLGNYSGPSQSAGLLNAIKPLLANTIVAIIVVIVVAYLIAFILGSIVKVPTGYLGLTELAVALILSYGLVLYTDRGSDILVKGTIIFFVSLIVLMIILIAL